MGGQDDKSLCACACLCCLPVDHFITGVCTLGTRWEGDSLPEEERTASSPRWQPRIHHHPPSSQMHFSLRTLPLLSIYSPCSFCLFASLSSLSLSLSLIHPLFVTLWFFSFWLSCSRVSLLLLGIININNYSQRYPCAVLCTKIDPKLTFLQHLLMWGKLRTFTMVDHILFFVLD